MPALLAAQDAPRMPIAPDSVLRPSAADAEFASWMRAQVQAGGAERAVVIQGGRFEVIAMSPLARAGLAPDSVLGAMAAACKTPMMLSDSLTAGIATIDPWRAFDAAADQVPAIAFSIIPSSGASVDCGAPESARRAGLARGVRFGRNSAYSATNDALRAELWVNGVQVVPVLRGRAPVTQVAESRLWLDGTAQVRLYVTTDALAPDAKGMLPTVELHVWNSKDEMPDRIKVDRTALRALWASELRWRAARMPAIAAGNVSGLPRFAAPSDTALRRAHQHFTLGDLRSATMIALDRLDARGLSDSDRRIMRLEVASAFEHAGESAGARIVAADALSADPCLTLSAAVDPRYARLVDAVRPPSRCTSMGLGWVAARSVVPGLGQLSGERRWGMSTLVVGAVAASFVVSAASHAAADEAFADYEAVTGFETENDPLLLMRNYHERATDKRAAGNRLATIGAGLWVLAGVEAVFTEYRHARRVRGVRDLGRPAGPRLSLLRQPGFTGIALSFEVR